MRWELERNDARFIAATAPAGSLDMVDADVAKAAWPALHDRVRRHRVGEVSANPETWKNLSDVSSGTDGPLRFLVHRDRDADVDGIAHFRLPWSAEPALLGVLQVELLEAATPAAYSAIWRLLTDFDLTRRIVAANRPVEEPLRWMLANPRALRVTRSADNLWLRVLDVPAALAARSYATTETLVLAVTDSMCPWNEGRWRLVGGPNGGHCEQELKADADLAVGVDTLSSLYVGGVSPAVLAQAGRIVQLRPGALATLSQLFRQDPAPFNAVGF